MSNKKKKINVQLYLIAFEFTLTYSLHAGHIFVLLKARNYFF